MEAWFSEFVTWLILYRLFAEEIGSVRFLDKNYDR